MRRTIAALALAAAFAAACGHWGPPVRSTPGHEGTAAPGAPSKADPSAPRDRDRDEQ
jgi:hypothetical protein